jgi:hypothetical protein
MRRALVLCLALALMAPAQSFTAMPACDGPADETAATRHQQDTQEKKKAEKKDPPKEEGTLDSFEAKATDEAKAPVDSVKTVEVEVEEDDGGFLLFIGEMIFFAVAIGSVGSWYRVTGEPEDWDLGGAWGRRQPGEPAIPFAAMNFSYEDVRSSDVEAFDGRFEGGYGPIGVMYRFTRFEEKDPDAHLDLSWLHGVVRESYTRYVEVGFAFGAVFLDGNGSESGFSFAMPFRVDPLKYVSLEYRPTWGWVNDSTITDEDLALCVGIRYVTLRAGYRWTQAQSATLEGPILGLLLSW